MRAPIPLAKLLQGLQLLASDDDREKAADVDHKGWDAATPASLQVIKSGATALTTHWTKRVQTAGGLTALLTGGAGALVSVLSPLNKVEASTWVPLAVTLLGGAAIVVAAAISVALFVKGDLEARGVASAARHEGRAAVAAEFLRATAAAPATVSSAGTTTSKISGTQPSESNELMLTIAAYGPGNISVDVPGESIVKGDVTGLKRVPDGLRIRVGGSGWIPIDKVTAFTTR